MQRGRWDTRGADVVLVLSLCSTFSSPPHLPLSLSPSLPLSLSLSSSLPHSLSPSLPPSILPSLPPSLHPSQWNLIDSSTGLTGTHTELSALSKEHTQVFTMSMWDLQRKFRCSLSPSLPLSLPLSPLSPSHPLSLSPPSISVYCTLSVT